jgi:hypothetical protein
MSAVRSTSMLLVVRAATCAVLKDATCEVVKATTAEVEND